MEPAFWKFSNFLYPTTGPQPGTQQCTNTFVIGETTLAGVGGVRSGGCLHLPDSIYVSCQILAWILGVLVRNTPTVTLREA